MDRSQRSHYPRRVLKAFNYLTTWQGGEKLSSWNRVRALASVKESVTPGDRANHRTNPL